ncbi:MAG: FtsK/SpoIIIE domain-containing protein [Saprospiraceae bacterium]
MSKFLNASNLLVKNLTASIKEVPTELPFDYTQMIDDTKMPTFLKVGNLIGVNGNNYPALLPLKRFKGLAFKLNDSNREEIHLAIQHYILQIVKQSAEGYVSITAIDTKKMGSNFRNLRRLGKNILSSFVADEENLKSTLDEHHNKSVSVITECLTHFENLADYNAKSGHVQPYRILAIADFPHGFNNLGKLETMLQNADEAGLFVFLTWDEALVTNSNLDKVNEILAHLGCFKEVGDPANDFYQMSSHHIPLFNKGYTLKLDRKDIALSNITKQIENLTTLPAIETDQIDGIRIPIGKSGGQTHYFTLGYETDNFHAIVGGQSGKGKSVLLNNIVARGIETYTSDELRFAIIDCFGTGFQEFDNAPGIQLICRSSNVETLMNAVQFIEKELVNRETLLKGVGVADLKQYIKKTNKPLPRLICLIDEFHVLYTGREKLSSYFDTILVDRVIKMGRKLGIHLVVCTQSLGGGVRRSILDNIPLRIAFGMTTEQSNGFLGLRNDKAANLDKGVAVYNSQNGNLSANKIVKVNWISTEDIEKIIPLVQQQNVKSSKFEKITI